DERIDQEGADDQARGGGEPGTDESGLAVRRQQQGAQDGADRVEIDRQLDQVDDGADGKIEGCAQRDHDQSRRRQHARFLPPASIATCAALGLADLVDPFVFAAVLIAAACHAGWNAAVKKGRDPLLATVPISIGAALVSAALAPLAGLPAAAAWPWL